MRTPFLAQVLLGGALVFVGCDAGELATPQSEVRGVLLDQRGHPQPRGDHELVLNVDVDEGSFFGPAPGVQGPFNVQGDTGSGASTFQCWGWILEDGAANVSQVFNIAGRGAIMTQGQEGGILAVVGGTGDFRNARGQADQVFTGVGFDFTMTFDLKGSTRRRG